MTFMDPCYRAEVCHDCKGSRKDPKKRTRKCPRCKGHGHEFRCLDCKKLMEDCKCLNL